MQATKKSRNTNGRNNMIIQEKIDAKMAQSFGHSIDEQIAKGPFTTIAKSDPD